VTVITEVEEKEEGVMAVEIWVSEEKWRIVGVYAKGDMERKLEVIGKAGGRQVDNNREDFNAKTGTLG